MFHHCLFCSDPFLFFWGGGGGGGGVGECLHGVRNTAVSRAQMCRTTGIPFSLVGDLIFCPDIWVGVDSSEIEKKRNCVKLIFIFIYY